MSQVRVTKADNFGLLRAERENAGPFIERVDEKLAAFLELEAAIGRTGYGCALAIYLALSTSDRVRIN